MKKGLDALPASSNARWIMALPKLKSAASPISSARIAAAPSISRSGLGKHADRSKAKAPARSLVSIDDFGVATALLAHDAARLITGETLYVDGGYHIMD